MRICFAFLATPPERETHNVEIKDDVISLEDLASYSILGKLPGFPCKLNYLISQTTHTRIEGMVVQLVLVACKEVKCRGWKWTSV